VSRVIYQLFVNGVPKAQPRPQVLRNGCVYTPHSADDWKAEIKAAFNAVHKPIITGPVRLTVRFSMPVPKRITVKGLPIPHIARPDTDNLLKAVMDAMTAKDCKVWSDDAQVFETVAGKYYTREKRTGAQITVETFEEE